MGPGETKHAGGEHKPCAVVLLGWFGLKQKLSEIISADLALKPKLNLLQTLSIYKMIILSLIAA